MPLRRIADPFDDLDWLFELKYDGFRALALIDNGRCRLVSRNVNEFKSFSTLAQEIGKALDSSVVLDGEIVCLDRRGRPQFYNLFYRRGSPVFVAFDILWRGEDDLRYLPLVDRKQELRRLLRNAPSCILYADHVHGDGVRLFERVCELDLEGIVAKHRGGHYTSDPEASTWFKVRNRSYSQWLGRHEAFERDRHAEPVPGWHVCALATAGIERLIIQKP
jgi:bifunctional non-homologous end joining protein LigD